MSKKPEGPKFCSRCGNAIYPSHKFCGNCGQKNVRPAHPFRILAVVVPLMLLSMVIVSVSALIYDVFNQPRTRTVMVYMIGSNLESEGSAASLDILEMTSATVAADDTKVLIYTGGAKRWALPDVSAEENAIFELKDGQLEKVQAYDQKPMTEAATLTEYLDFAHNHYESNFYDLILWDHGGGPIFGYGQDETTLTGKPMPLSALVNALENSAIVQTKQRFELIGFDACLMGSLEIGTALQPYARYMVASEEVEPGMGWNYEFLSNVNRDADPEAVGTEIINQYIHAYDNYKYDVDLSLSIIDLDQIPAIIESASLLFSRLNSALAADSFSNYSRTLTSEKIYGYTGRADQSYDLVDLKDLVSKLDSLYPDEVRNLNEKIDAAVLAAGSNMAHTNGLSFYFPTMNKANLTELLTRYKTVAFSPEYYNFLLKYAGFVTGDPLVKQMTYSDLKTTKDDNKVSIELPEELISHYQSGEIIIYRKLAENQYAPVYRSSEVALTDNILSATTTNLQFVLHVTDKDGKNDEYGWVALYEKERTADYADYVTFGTLGYADDSSLGWSMKSQATYLRLKTGETKAEVRDVRLGTSADDELAGKLNLEPDKIKFAEYVVGTYKLFDENGHRLDKIESYGELYGSGVSLEKGEKYEFELVDLDFDFGDMYSGKIKKSALKDYYAEFIVHDTQGVAHNLNLVHIK